jgi:hypothetical protein
MSERDNRSTKIGAAVLTVTAGLAVGVAACRLSWAETGAPPDPAVDFAALKIVQRPAGMVMPSDQASEARAAIGRGDFSTAGSIMGKVVAKSQLRFDGDFPLDVFMDHVARGDSDFAAQLDQWVGKDSGSALPYLVRARYLYHLAWSVRGTGEHPLPAHLDASAALLRRALGDLVRAVKLARDSPDAAESLPYAAESLVDALLGGGNSPVIGAAFKGAIASFPDDYELYRVRLTTLAPKWGGTIAEMRAFAERYAAAAADDSPLKLLYVKLYVDLLDAAAIDCGHAQPDAKGDCVAKEMGASAPAGLDDKVRAALADHTHTDITLYDRLLGPILKRAIYAGKGTEAFSGQLLDWAASSMGTDIRLNEDPPGPSGRNNYLLDEMTAQVWLRDGYQDNGVTKLREAIDDTLATPFPSEAEKLYALSHLYSLLAFEEGRKERLPEMLAYQKAAESLGGNIVPEYRYLACNAYFRLDRLAEAVTECSRQIANGDGVVSRYWRGECYEKMGQWQAALEDYQQVADSEEHDYRERAVINMSLIYDKLHDFAKGAAVYNDHPYIFDPDLTDRDSVAVAYNNRCYAYMKTGLLQKALDDCNMSLKFGNIPDAVSKRNKLIKMLTFEADFPFESGTPSTSGRN